MNDNRYDFPMDDAFTLVPRSTSILRTTCLMMIILAVILGGILTSL